MQNILIYEPWNLGDVAIALHFIKVFKDKYKSTNIHFVCKPLYTKFVETTNLVNSMYGFSPNWTKRNFIEKYNPFSYKISEFITFAKYIKSKKIDIIILVRKDIRALIILKILTGFKFKIIYPKINPLEGGYNNILYYFDYFKIQSRILEKQIINHKIKTITIFGGASDFNRQLPISKLKEVVNNLLSFNYELNIIASSKVEKEVLENLFSNLKNCLRIYFKSIEDITNLIINSDLVISTDSGWLHIASLYNKPTIGLFGFDTTNAFKPPNCTVIFPKKVLLNNLRYKKKFNKIQPLFNLDTNDIINCIKKIDC